MRAYLPNHEAQLRGVAGDGSTNPFLERVLQTPVHDAAMKKPPKRRKRKKHPGGVADYDRATHRPKDEPDICDDHDDNTHEMVAVMRGGGTECLSPLNLDEFNKFLSKHAKGMHALVEDAAIVTRFLLEVFVGLHVELVPATLRQGWLEDACEERITGKCYDKNLENYIRAVDNFELLKLFLQISDPTLPEYIAPALNTVPVPIAVLVVEPAEDDATRNVLQPIQVQTCLVVSKSFDEEGVTDEVVPEIPPPWPNYCGDPALLSFSEKRKMFEVSARPPASPGNLLKLPPWPGETGISNAVSSLAVVPDFDGGLPQGPTLVLYEEEFPSDDGTSNQWRMPWPGEASSSDDGSTNQWRMPWPGEESPSDDGTSNQWRMPWPGDKHETDLDGRPPLGLKYVPYEDGSYYADGISNQWRLPWPGELA